MLDAKGDVEEQLHEMFDAEGVSWTPQLAYLGVMYPGENAFPGAYVEGFGEAWNAVIASWKSHEGRKPGPTDRLHVETHVLENRDVFITDDSALRVMCRRLRDEHSIVVEAMSLEEYLDRRRGTA